jgi:hypothetical protein
MGIAIDCIKNKKQASLNETMRDDVEGDWIIDFKYSCQPRRGNGNLVIGCDIRFEREKGFGASFFRGTRMEKKGKQNPRAKRDEE